jgi:predicted phosphodiesterase
MATHFIVSDVHLGSLLAKTGEFQNFLSLPKDGDVLILLGDILDFWISTDTDEEHVDTFVKYWCVLHDWLTELSKNGVKIFYVPGNHDSIVFYLECARLEQPARPRWISELREWCGTYSRLLNETNKCRLADVCEIYYPFLRQDINGIFFLFTHGHFTESYWKLMGQAFGTNVKEVFWPLLKGLANCLSHRYAREIRKTYLELYPDPDEIPLAKTTQDLGYCILAHELLESRGTVFHKDGPARQVEFGDVASLGQNLAKRLTDFKSVQTEECLKHGHEIMKDWQTEFPVENLMNDIGLMIDQAELQSYRLGGTPVLETSPIKSFQGFNRLMYGHFHMPRYTPFVVDTGGMVEQGKLKLATYVTIDSGGGFVLHT